MENSVSADDGGLQTTRELVESEQIDGKVAPRFLETDNDDFDAHTFASMLQQDLIAHSVSWDPLVKVLQALGKSMARHQRTQQGYDESIKKIQDQVVEQMQQVAALRDDVSRAGDEKKQAAAALEAMQSRVGELQSQVEENKELAPREGENDQRQDGTSDREQGLIGAGNSEDGVSVVAKEPSQASQEVNSIAQENDLLRENSGLQEKELPREKSLPQIKNPPLASTIDGPQFVTLMDLAEAKRELREELTNALAQALSPKVIDESHEKKSNESIQTEPSAQIDNDSRVVKAPSPRLNEVQPSRTLSFSSKELEQNVERLQGLQDALTAKLLKHDLLLDEIKSQMAKLDENLSQGSASFANQRLGGETVDADGSTGVSALPKEVEQPHVDLTLDLTSILKDLKDLKAVQDDYDLKLRDHDTAVEKHTADIKALTDSLDDLSVQQQTVASMFTSGPRNGGSVGSSIADVAADNPVNSVKVSKQVDAEIDLPSQPQLDLSLVFTKLADLRRSTDASFQSVQQMIKGVSSTTQAQQDQLNALRKRVVSDQLVEAHLVEARLAMQKEFLGRNQAFQDHTKLQLAEWRKALELTEDSLFGGMSDDGTLNSLQQMQRNYHRTLLSVTPLISSPQIILDTLQTLLDEVKQLQSAGDSGVVPSRNGDHNNSGDQAEGKENKDDQGEYERKLMYLAKEIDATLRLNITTEKKNDPLLKGLDAMREKLEELWSTWHRNYNVSSAQPSEVLTFHDDAHIAGGGQNGFEERHQSIQLRNPDGLREIDMRLSGAVRRLAVVEEDIERLNSLTADLTAAGTFKLQGNEESTMTVASRRSSSTNTLQAELIMNEIDKLRKDVYDEMANIMGKLEDKDSGRTNNNYNSTASIVLPDHRNLAENFANHGDVLTNVFPSTTSQELSTRVITSKDDPKQFYDTLIPEITKKVLDMVNFEKGSFRGPGSGGPASANVNFRLLLNNLAQKVDDRLENARDMTSKELARFRKELMDQLNVRFEVAVRDIRGELMLLQPIDGDSTAMGTKAIMCVACSRPVPVSSVVREAGSPPVDMANLDAMNPSLAAEFDYDRSDDEFVFRAGFKMPSNDRKIMTLPILTTAMRNKMANKPEGKRRRPPRQSLLNRVDNVVREAMDLDRTSRSRGVDAQ